MEARAFLFTDIEGSVGLWEESPDEMGAALREHDSRMRRFIRAEGGEVFKTMGDAFCAVFPSSESAARAAISTQRALSTSSVGIPLRVRMAIHWGDAEARDGDYFGPALNRVARLLGVGYGGQILTTGPAAALLTPESVEYLGEHRLRDLAGRERVSMLLAPGLSRNFPPLRTLDTLPNNLPRHLSPLIGRDGERRNLKESLATGRLATLVGPGGVGKTRLATSVAAEILGGRLAPDGAWFVDLSSAIEGDEIEARVLDAVGAEAGDSAPRALRAWARERGVLVVLDNCEHVLEGAARAARTLLDAGRCVHVLATSREAIGHPEERIVRVEPLSPPDPHEDPAENDAVRLFVARAEAAGARPLTREDLKAAATIVHRLEGIPLAIELAAARTRSISPRDLLPRLDRALSSADGRRATSARHSTLAATIEWSVRLLTPVQRRVLERLASFADGFTLAAAEVVGAEAVGTEPPTAEGMDVPSQAIGAWEAGEAAAALVDRSLARAETRDEGTRDEGTRDEGTGDEGTQEGSTRYRLYETVRQFIAQRSPGAGDVALLRWATEEARRIKADGADLSRLEPERDNIRAAYRFPLPGPEEIEALFTLDAEITPWLVSRLTPAEHVSLRRRLLARAGEVPDSLASLALSAGAFVAGHLGDFDAAREWGGLSQAAAERAGDPLAILRALNALGATSVSLFRNREAAETFARASEFAESLLPGVVAPKAVWAARMNYSAALTELGDYAAAWDQMEAARRIVATGNTDVEDDIFAVREGALLLNEGDAAAAIPRLEAAGRFFLREGKISHLLEILVDDIPNAYLETGRRDDALRVLTSALQTALDEGYEQFAVIAAERLSAMGVDVTIPEAPELMRNANRELTLFARAEGRAARSESFEDLLQALARKEGESPFVGAPARRLARLLALASPEDDASGQTPA